MAVSADSYPTSSKRVKNLIKEKGLKCVDPERIELCIAGLDLCVLNGEEDMLFILKGAENIYAAQRRLKTRLREQ